MISRPLYLIIMGFIASIGGSFSAFASDDLPYETCTAQNNYLEQKVVEQLGGLIIPLSPNASEGEVCQKCAMKGYFPFNEISSQFDPFFKGSSPILTPLPEDLKCVFLAQKNMGGGYANCNEPGSALVVKKIKPCLSKNYVELTTRALNLASKCTDLPKREIFALFLQESSMQMNSVNTGSRAGGVGQLTTVAIQGIQQVDDQVVGTAAERETARRIQTKIETDPQCEDLKAVNAIRLTDQQAANRCEILSFPRNPMYPMLTSMKLYSFYKARALEKLKREVVLSKLSLEQIDSVAAELTYYSYNAGFVGIYSCFQTYLRTVSGKKVGPTSISDGFRYYLKTHYVLPRSSKGPITEEEEQKYQKRLQDKRHELSSHVRAEDGKNGILNRMELLEEKAGGRCFKE